MDKEAYTSVMLRGERKPRLAAMRSHTTYPPTDPIMPQSKAHNEKAKHITRKSCPRIPKGGRLKAELKSHKQGRFASSLKEHEPVSLVFRGKLLLNSENTKGLSLECKDLEEPALAKQGNKT